MPADYYADAAPANPGPAMPENEPETDESTADNQTAVLPKSVLGGKEFKPGEEVVLEVVEVMEDSVLVKYASEKGGEEEDYGSEGSESEAAAPPASGGNQMSALME